MTKTLSQIKQGDIFTLNSPDSIRQNTTVFVYNICLSRRKTGIRALVVGAGEKSREIREYKFDGKLDSFAHTLCALSSTTGFSPME
jgi:hypothetical protein